MFSWHEQSWNEGRKVGESRGRAVGFRLGYFVGCVCGVGVTLLVFGLLPC